MGGTLREHLKSLERQNGIPQKALQEAPDLPNHTEDIWGWFLELHNERESNGMEAGRITATQMIDWCWATGNHLALWQRRAIRSLDSAWFRSKAK